MQRYRGKATSPLETLSETLSENGNGLLVLVLLLLLLLLSALLHKSLLLPFGSFHVLNGMS